MRRTVRRQPRVISWGQSEDGESCANSLVGPMRSAHLFRSRKAPLHHRYALLCFGINNWVRIERGARCKTRGSPPQTESLRPFFGRVQLSEPITFATRKEDLVEEADELATVMALPKSDTTSTRPAICIYHPARDTVEMGAFAGLETT